MKRFFILIFLFTAVHAVALPVRAACQGDRSPEGVCKDQVNIGSSVVLTGPLGLWGNNIARVGPRAYFDMVNARGGVHGRRINYIVYNDFSRPERAVVNVKRLIERDGVLCILLQTGTMTNRTSYKYVTEVKKVPLMFPATQSHFWNSPFKRYVFPLSPSLSMQAYILMDYLVLTRGFSRIGILFQEDPFGSEVRQAARRRLAEHGLSPAGEEGLKARELDVSAQLMKLRGKGAEAVVLAVPYNAASRFMGEARKLGWGAQLGGVGFTGLPALLKMAGKAAVGYVNVMSMPPAEYASGPAMEEYRRWLRKHSPDVPYDSSTLTGWWAAKLLTEILRRSGRNLSRENMIKAAESIRGYDTGITPPLSFYPHDHSGTTAAYIAVARAHDGGLPRFIPLGPDSAGGAAVSPLWISSWEKSVEEVAPIFKSLRQLNKK